VNRLGVRLPAGAEKGFSTPPQSQTGSATHQSSYLMGTGLIPPDVKRLGREGDHKSPPGADVKNMWSHIQLLPTPSWRGV